MWSCARIDVFGLAGKILLQRFSEGRGEDGLVGGFE